MFHLAVYSASIAATALTQVAAITDNVLAPSGSGLLVNPQVPKIAAMMGVGNLLVRGQLTSPSLKKYDPFDFSPVSVGTKVGTPAPFMDFKANPIDLVVNEELDAFVVNSGAGATQTQIGVLFCDGPIVPIRGRMFTVHWTASTTLTANAWTTVVPTLDNGLPGGQFALVGSRMKSAGAEFHRFVPRGGSAMRPGTFAVQANSDLAGYDDRYGGMGTWLQFSNTTMPNVEVFSLSADTSEEGYLDLIQIG